MFGLAIFVTVGQLPKLFGVEKGSGDTIKQFIHLIGHLGDTSGATLPVGAGDPARVRSRRYLAAVLTFARAPG